MSVNKARGTRWESAVVDFLRNNAFLHAERRALNGSRDLGDVTGIPGVVIECKSQARHSLAEWVDEAEQERANAHADVAAVWVKRRGFTSAGNGYVVMDGETFAYLLRSSGYSNLPKGGAA